MANTRETTAVRASLTALTLYCSRSRINRLAMNAGRSTVHTHFEGWLLRSGCSGGEWDCRPVRTRMAPIGHVGKKSTHL